MGLLHTGLVVFVFIVGLFIILL